MRILLTNNAVPLYGEVEHWVLQKVVNYLHGRNKQLDYVFIDSEIDWGVRDTS